MGHVVLHIPMTSEENDHVSLLAKSVSVLEKVYSLFGLLVQDVRLGQLMEDLLDWLAVFSI